MQGQRNTHVRFRSAALLACMLWCSFFVGRLPGGQAAGTPQNPASAERVVVKAGDLQMVMEKTGQGVRLLSLDDAAKGQTLSDANAPALFSVVLREVKTKELVTLTARSGWNRVDISQSDATRGYRLTFDAPTDGRLDGVRVDVTLDSRSEPNVLTWDLQAANSNPQWGLWRVVFPQASVRDLGDDGRVFAEVTSGVELADLWDQGGKRGGTYPGGWTAMQYMAAYNRARRTGLYIGMHDPFGSTKDIFAEGQPAGHAVVFTFDHPVPDMGKPAVGFDLPGEARWQLLRGDWFDAAQIYRAWVMQKAKWWPTLGPGGREDTPKWMRELPAWVMTGGAPADCVTPVKAFVQAIGGPTGFHWYNWHQIPFDNDYPHYFPVKDGFREGVAELRKAGVHPMPYINGRLWDTRDKGAEDWEFTRTALPAATKEEGGNPCTESYGSKETDGNSVKLAVMCPATALWQSRVGEIVLRLFNEYGVSGVYIDQIAAAQPRLCFDAAHGHPLGGGHWWTEGYWKMLDAIRAAKPVEAMLTTECNAEPYIRWLDGYLTWHWQQQDMVPAFSAVYGGAIQMFGRAYRGGPSQDLANRMKAGQQLVYGEQIGWFGPEIIGRADSGGFLRDCILLRRQFGEYFYKGQMARPPRPTGSVPKVTADWQWSGEWPVTTDAILTGAWRLPQEDKVVLLFANVSDSPISCAVELDLAGYGLAGKALTATAVRPDGTRVPLAIQTFDRPALELASRSILAWELRPAAGK